MFRPTAFPHVQLASLGLLFTACQSQESSRVLETPAPEMSWANYRGPAYPVSIGRFSNASPYLRGVFTPEGSDRLGNQARSILKSALSNTGRFQVLDRENLSALEQESGFSGEQLQIQGADVVLTGQVTEFGRKRTGDKQLFGIVGKGKKQTAYSKVAISVVDARTSAVLFSVEGAGEYSLSDREVLGFGSESGYDSTLNGKVLGLAIREAVDKLALEVDAGAFAATESDR